MHSYKWLSNQFGTAFYFGFVFVIVPTGIMHSLGSDGDIYVCAFLVPVLDEL